MRWLDLFSGIGMYAKGLEEAGHEVIGFCENEKWARKVLKKHWPTKPISWCVKSLNKALEESLQDFHAKTFPQPTLPHQVEPPALPAAEVDSSGRRLEPLAWWDANTSCWRTWQRSFSQAGKLIWQQYLEPWPPSGLIVNGIAWQRQPLAHPTTVPEHTFLPTILASECRGVSRKRYKGSPNFYGTRTAEPFRTSESCPTLLNPLFGEELMGLPRGYTELETETPHASSES